MLYPRPRKKEPHWDYFELRKWEVLSLDILLCLVIVSFISQSQADIPHLKLFFLSRIIVCCQQIALRKGRQIILILVKRVDVFH